MQLELKGHRQVLVLIVPQEIAPLTDHTVLSGSVTTARIRQVKFDSTHSTNTESLALEKFFAAEKLFAAATYYEGEDGQEEEKAKGVYVGSSGERSGHAGAEENALMPNST